jgi:circadian clock protein KaiC
MFSIVTESQLALDGNYDRVCCLKHVGTEGTKKKTDGAARLPTGVRNLDELFHGGLPKGSVIVVAGPPGAGKTILTQQICFHNATSTRRVLYFNTLSEPTAKTLRYLSAFTYFESEKLDGSVRFIDLGAILRAKGLEEAARLIMEQVKKTRPHIVVIDSFKVFDDLATSREELRKFGYELAVHLMAWEITAFLLGEYGPTDVATNPLFSIVDGLFMVTQREQSGEQQRFFQVVKMRGTDHSRDEHSFVITSSGVEVFAPRVTIRRDDRGPGSDRLKTGISKLDELLGEGIPRGSSLLVGGVAGTGKTVLLLEFLYRGALAGEKGIIFSFEETEARLRSSARGLGWDLDREIDRGMVEIVFIPQPEIMVEGDLLMMQMRVESFEARRVAVDSVSVFLHKIKDPQIDREKVFQLASIVQNAQAVGLFATDIPYGTNQISRFGVEETVVDGVFLLTSTSEALDRRRYLEVYKLRNTAHLGGRHDMAIGRGGIEIFPRYAIEAPLQQPPPPLDPARRFATGVPGLDELCGGGLLARSFTLVSGSAGIGKTTLALQFIADGARRNEPGLYIALEEGPEQLGRTAAALGLPLDHGLVDFMYLSREYTRPSQFLAILDHKVRMQHTRRLVLDSVGQMLRAGAGPLEDLRQVLHALVVRFKQLDVTGLLTLEADSLFSLDTVTERGYSPLADNLWMLRYASVQDELRPTLTVVKARGSAHDRGTYYFTVGEGGVRIGERATTGAPPARAAGRAGPGKRRRPR